MDELSIIYSNELTTTVYVTVSIAFLAAYAAIALLLTLRSQRFFRLAPSALAIALRFGREISNIISIIT